MTEDTYRILIAEDNKELQKLYRAILQKHTLYVVDNGLDAGNFYQARNQDLNLVITDLSMPILTGDKLIQFIRGYEGLFRIKRKPIILCTGDKEPNKQRIDYDRLLTKPFDIKHLEHTIEDLIHQETR